MKVLELSRNELVVLKIGGSVITDKERELGARTDVISRIADEIYETGLRKLIIVHGGGSFGHPFAQKYLLKDGFKSEEQVIGFAETHHVMTVLNGLFMDALIWRGIPAVSIAPSSCVITRNGRIQHFEDAPLLRSLEMDIIPVLYGDVVFDSKLGFTVLSGDQIVSYIAQKLKASRIIIGVDVDGLYDDDPKVNPKAKLFSHLTLQELTKIKSSIGGSIAPDVTGGMASKISELLPAIEQGIPVFIVNAAKPKTIYKALKGEKVEGTIIEKE